MSIRLYYIFKESDAYRIISLAASYVNNVVLPVLLKRRHKRPIHRCRFTCKTYTEPHVT